MKLPLPPRGISTPASRDRASMVPIVFIRIYMGGSRMAAILPHSEAEKEVLNTKAHRRTS
jgi:hypothetical protein